MLINRDFRLLWAGQVASAVGDFMFTTTLTLWIGTILLRDNAFAPAAVSGTLIVIAVATVVFGPLCGVFVDRWDPRRTMMAADLARAGVMLAVAAVPALEPSATLAIAYTAVFTATGLAQLFHPARFVLVGEIVPPEQRGRAAGIGQTTHAIAVIAGPAIAAPLVFATGPQGVSLINACTFLVSFLAIRAVRSPVRQPRPPRSGVRGEFADGLKLVVGHRVVRTILVTIVVATSGIGALTTLGVFFVTENLKVAPQWYGAFETAFGLGLVAGALGASVLGARLGYRALYAVGVSATGAGMIVGSRLTDLWPELIVLLLVGFPAAVAHVALTPLLLDAVPPTHQGRVLAVISPAEQLAALAGGTAAGWLTSTVLVGFRTEIAGIAFGRIDTVLTIAGALVLLSGLHAWRALRSTG